MEESEVTVTREIDARDWNDFLHAFSEQNQGRHVRLETTIPPGEGTPLVAEHEPLMGVELDSKGSAALAITVMLGGMDAAAAHLTHVISHPTHLWSEEDAGGMALALDIDSEEEGKTLLLFEREAALPPAQER
jgi:hypothetical protein